jgi:hypothetical protein
MTNDGRTFAMIYVDRAARRKLRALTTRLAATLRAWRTYGGN